MTSVPFLFLSFETNILTILSIIDIWNSNFWEKIGKVILRKGGDEARLLISKEFFSK